MNIFFLHAIFFEAIISLSSHLSFSKYYILF